MKKIIALLFVSGSLLFGAINLQTASKEELMSIKGIGEKKAEQIMDYRKSSKISKPEDLKNIKGFGDSVVDNVTNDVKVKEKSVKKAEKLEKKLEKKSEKKLEKESKKLENKVN